MNGYEPAGLFDSVLNSARRISFDPGSGRAGESDTAYGMAPAWSPLYGTPTWSVLSEPDRARLTRGEVAQFLGVAIWLEVGRQIALLRAYHSSDPARPEVVRLLDECADDNLHSLMFVNAVHAVGSQFHPLSRRTRRFGWLLRSFAWEEAACGIVMAGAQIFDAMQRDWMADADVADVIREAARRHLADESRNTAFARDQIGRRLTGASWLRRYVSAVAIAMGARVIVDSLVSRQVYDELGLNWPAVRSDIAANEHHRAMLRTAAAPFVEFVDAQGMLNRTARRIYRKSNFL